MGHAVHRKIGKRAGVVGFFTFISRILGLARDAVIAYFLGATATADAFYVAFRIPNLLRRLTAEGALTIAFVPVFTDYLRKSKKDAREVASVVFTYLALALVGITLLGILFAPYIVKLIAWGFQHSQEKFDLTVFLARIMFPYILLISLTALAMGILNSLKHFASPAASPILLNISIIIGAAFFSRWFEEPTLGLAVGVLVGGCAQLGLQIPAMAKRGMLPRLNFNYKHPGLKSLLFLMIPAAFGAAVYQVNVMIITLLASFLPDGSVSYLWYADRVTEFPLGVFAIAIATATLPTLSDHASAKDLGSFKTTFRFSLKSAFAITIPSAIGLYILATPVIRFLFQRGEFTSVSTAGTVGALMFFVIGLPFVSGVRNVVPAFFAMKDSKTPVAIATVTVICNAILALLLMRPMLHRGLALAISVANFINFSLLIIFLRRKIGPLGMGDLFKGIARIIFASMIMGVAVFLFKNYAFPSLFEKGLLELIIGIFSSIAVGVIFYVVALRILKAPELDMFISILKKLEGKGSRTLDSSE